MVGSDGTGTFAGEVAAEGTLILSYLLDEESDKRKEKGKRTAGVGVRQGPTLEPEESPHGGGRIGLGGRCRRQVLPGAS